MFQGKFRPENGAHENYSTEHFLGYSGKMKYGDESLVTTAAGESSMRTLDELTSGQYFRASRTIRIDDGAPDLLRTRMI